MSNTPLERLARKESPASIVGTLQTQPRKQFAGKRGRMPPWKRAGNAILRVLKKGKRTP